MGRAGVNAGESSCAGKARRRYRNIEHIDLNDLRQQVSRWFGEHPDGTDEQITGDLTPAYPDYDPGELAIVLRAALFTEKRERQP